MSWATAIEINNLGFEIEKSTNGRNWEIIDFVVGQGTTTEIIEYQYEDLNPFSGINYYRLKHIDIDGAFEYLKVITIEFSDTTKNINVFSNPSSGLINLQIDNSLNQRMEIKISDNLGRIFWERRLIEDQSIWKNEIEIERNGIYFVTAQIGAKIYYERLVVRDEK